MRPNFLSRIFGSTACIKYRAERKLPSIASCHISGVLSVNAEGGGPPLLVTRMSGSAQTLRIADLPSTVLTSPTASRTSTLNVERMCAAVSVTSAAVRPLMRTLTPSRASDSAHALPKPRLDPAITAQRPAIPRSITAQLFRGP